MLWFYIADYFVQHTKKVKFQVYTNPGKLIDDLRISREVKVLIADMLLRDHEVMAMIGKAEAMRAAVIVLSSSFEPGERLVVLGGIAALLRYKIT